MSSFKLIKSKKGILPSINVDYKCLQDITKTTKLIPLEFTFGNVFYNVKNHLCYIVLLDQNENDSLKHFTLSLIQEDCIVIKDEIFDGISAFEDAVNLSKVNNLANFILNSSTLKTHGFVDLLYIGNIFTNYFESIAKKIKNARSKNAFISDELKKKGESMCFLNKIVSKKAGSHYEDLLTNALIKEYESMLSMKVFCSNNKKMYTVRDVESSFDDEVNTFSFHPSLNTNIFSYKEKTKNKSDTIVSTIRGFVDSVFIFEDRNDALILTFNKEGVPCLYSFKEEMFYDLPKFDDAILTKYNNLKYPYNIENINQETATKTIYPDFENIDFIYFYTAVV